jgi:hypothetical protein
MKTTTTLINCSLAAALALAPNMNANAQGGKSNGNNTDPSSVFVLSGNVFDDGDGLTDGMIDGTAINNQVYSQGQLRVILVNNNTNTVEHANIVVGNSVNTNGAYTINAQTNSQYALILTAANPSLGSTNPIIGIPSEWAYTGEGNTAAGDGIVDGIVTLAAGPLTSLTVNFGIDRRPNTYSTSINPNAVQYDANGMVKFNPSMFTGNDGEDGNYSAGLSGRSVDLYKATNGTLYYNGTAINFTAANTKTTIQNFDYNKLRLLLDPGATTFIFSYSVRDNANISELVPSYITSGMAPRESHGKSHTKQANRSGNLNLISWTASEDASVLGFEVERSYDGINFTTVGKVPAKAGDISEYKYEDETADLSQTAYYRVRDIALDGVGASQVMKVASKAAAMNDAIRIAPNPTNGPLNMSFWQDQAGEVAVSIISTTGQEVYRESFSAERGNNTRTLTPSNLAAGTYFVKVRTATGNQMTQPVVIMQ